MKIIGFDCASQLKNIGITFSDYNKETGWKVHNIIQGNKSEEYFYRKLEEYSNEHTLICFDTPLGWPHDLVNFIQAYEASALTSDVENPLIYETEGEKIFKRITEQKIKKALKMNPLENGADKITRTSYKTIEIITEMRKRGSKCDIIWDSEKIDPMTKGISVIEVYPKATLAGLNKALDPGKKFDLSYKGKDNKKEAREFILQWLEEQLLLSSEMSQDDFKNLSSYSQNHKLDSLICCYAGKQFVDGLLTPHTIASQEEQEIIMKEGWVEI